MDWYLIGRIVGMVFWPGLVALVLWSLGWVLALSRQPHVAVVIRSWFRVAAFVGFVGTLFFTGRDFLKYTGAIT